MEKVNLAQFVEMAQTLVQMAPNTALVLTFTDRVIRVDFQRDPLLTPAKHSLLNSFGRFATDYVVDGQAVTFRPFYGY